MEWVIKCCVGDEVSRNNATQLTNAGKSYILDPLMLFTIVLLDVHKEVLQYLGKLYITQSTLDLYLRLSKEDFELERSTYEKIYTWAKSHCSLALAIGNDDFPDNSDAFNVMDISFSDTIKAATYSSLILISNDFSYRSIAKHLGVDGVWLQIILVKALKEECLSQTKYATAISHLVSEKNDFTSFNTEDLISLAQQADWEIDDTLKNLLSALGNKEVHLASAVIVGGGFLKFVWNRRGLSVRQRKNMTYTVFSSLRAWKSNSIIEALVYPLIIKNAIPSDFSEAIKEWREGYFLTLPSENIGGNY